MSVCKKLLESRLVSLELQSKCSWAWECIWVYIMWIYLLQVRYWGGNKFHETYERRLFYLCAFLPVTHWVTFWQIRIVLNNWVYVVARYVEGLKSCFLKELSVTALPMNPMQLLNSGVAACAVEQWTDLGVCAIHLHKSCPISMWWQPILLQGSCSHNTDWISICSPLQCRFPCILARRI